MTSRRVLIVDDDPVSRMMVSHMITSCGHATWAAESVDEAEQLMADNEFDIAICDYLMPKRTGLDLVEACAERSIPFALLTGFAEDGHLTDGRTDLVAAHLTKPVSTAGLADAIDRLCAGSTQTESRAAVAD